MAPKNSVTVRVHKEIGNLVALYCKFHDIQMFDFANDVLRSRLKEFKEMINEMKKLDCDK